ncbi:HAD-IA family hydrolase [Glaciihabitans arcticus]|uniref:HAD-IA family hydrolase n=1 Tax=Glaciihabitans arcticus TaxID=2668039 RepID=UPI001F01B457|nr:HAD-IA family hydrolase [Glaciihabitans arcticus]
MTTTINARAILFDMDGTIVDSTAIVERVWGRFADTYGVSLSTILGDSHGIKAIDTIRKYGPTGIDAEVAAADLAAFEIGEIDGIVEIPGAAVFANSLRPEQIALVTSAPRELAILRLDLCAITVPRVIVAAEDVEHGKPHPEPYLNAARLLGLKPADCIVFEDAAAGIRSGIAAGMRVVVVGELDDPVTDGLPRIPDYSAATVDQTADGLRIVLG